MGITGLELLVGWTILWYGVGGGLRRRASGMCREALLESAQYSTVTVLVFRYSFMASIPRSLPNPDCLKPPKGAATSVLL